MNTTMQAHTFYVTQGLGNSIKPILLASQSSLPGCEANVNVLDGNSSNPIDLQSYKNDLAWLLRFNTHPSYQPPN